MQFNPVIGQVYHFFSIFERGFYRCVAVQTGDLRMVPGLKVIGLAGEWDPQSLPHRSPTGEVITSTFAEDALNEVILPLNETYVWEAQPRLQQRFPGIPDAPLIDLSVPDMTPEEEATAKLWKRINEIRDVAIAPDSRFDPEEILQELRDLISNEVT